MTRTLKLVLVCTLVICSVFVTQTYEINVFGMSSVSASDVNMTRMWDDFNQTIDDLKDWFNSTLLAFQNNLSSDINESTEDIIDYITERTNFSQLNITLEGVTIEGINESSVLGRLMAIEDALGYNNNATVYEDISAILLGLVDNEGKYVLRDSAGVSSFFLMGEMMVNLNTNQGVILGQVVVEGNSTRTLVQGETTNIKSKIDATGEWIAANSGSFWSIISAVCMLFFLFWIFFLRRYLAGRYHESETDQSETEQRQLDNPGKPATMLDKFNPLKKTGSIPRCYKDGVSYDPVSEPACGPCPYAFECESVKLNYQADLEVKKELAESHEIDAGKVSGETDISPVTELDVSKW